MIRDEAAMDWWNQLTPEQRLAVAGELPTELPHPGPGSDWSLPWERLLPFTQQLRLQMYYRLIIARQSKNNKKPP